MSKRLLGLTLAWLALAASAAAQETTTGSLGGQVVDPQGLPLPGVTVTITSTGAPRSIVTDEQGRFFVAFLTPGIYGVRAELQGFAPVEQPRVEVRLGQRAELNLALAVGGLAETVQVTGNTGVVDVTNTTVGANLDSEMLARLPVQRQLGDTLYLAPGVSSGGGTGRQNPSVGGSSGLENQYMVDGVNITNPGYGALGSYSIVLGSLGTGVTFDFIQEVQVKTAGYEAQYGQATGGVVSVVTKTGSNRLRGTAFAYAQPSFAQASFTPIETTNATRPEAVNTTETQVSDAGVEISGPIVRDRLFFFAAVDPQRDRTTLIAPTGFPLRSAGEFTRERNVLAYSAKATWQPTGSSRIDASFFGDPGHGPIGPQRRTALLRTDTSGFSELDSFGGHNQTVRYNGTMSAHWLLEGSVARSTNGVTEIPSVDANAVIDRRTEPNIRSGGIGFYENNDGETLQLQAFSTHVLSGMGQHQIRYGVQYEDVDYDNIASYSGAPFTLSNGQQTVTGASLDILEDATTGATFYRVNRANLSNIRTTRQSYVSVFAQDVWQIGTRLTIRPGVRYDAQKLEGNLADYTFDGNWAPRLGVTWDPLGQGRMKVFANYGHFYARIPNDLAARALSADAGVTRADYYDADLTQPIPEGVSLGGSTRHLILAGLSPSTFDPNAGSTYSREAVAGFEWEAVPGLSLGVRYTARRFARVLEDVGTLPMVAYFLEDVPGAESVEYFITNPGPETPVAGNLGEAITFEKAVHDYDAFEVEADRRFAGHWSLQASYRYSRTRGNFEGFFRNDNGQSDPGITSLFDFPTNDPTYATIGATEFGFRGDVRYLGTAGIGPLPNDRRHQGKIFGSYVVGGVNLGLGLNLSSGRPLTALAVNPVYETEGEIPETPRGAGFETEQGFRRRTPFESTIDLHGDYAFRIPRGRLVVLADAFNLFNQQGVRDYDDYTESAFGVTNADFGRILAYQTPFTLRVGARLEF